MSTDKNSKESLVSTGSSDTSGKHLPLREMGANPPAYSGTISRHARRDEISESLLKRSGISPLAVGYTLEKVQHDLVRKVIGNFIKDASSLIREGAGIMLTGEVGVGKTAIASMIGVEAVRCGHSVTMVTHGDVQEAQFNDRPDTDGQSVKGVMLQADLLILDGFGVEFLSDNKFGPIQLESLILKRVKFKRSTILTTRIMPPQMKREAGSLFSVIQEKMVGIVVQGKDMRQKSNEDLMRRLGMKND